MSVVTKIKDKLTKALSFTETLERYQAFEQRLKDADAKKNELLDTADPDDKTIVSQLRDIDVEIDFCKRGIERNRDQLVDAAISESREAYYRAEKELSKLEERREKAATEAGTHLGQAIMALGSLKEGHPKLLLKQINEALADSRSQFKAEESEILTKGIREGMAKGTPATVDYRAEKSRLSKALSKAPGSEAELRSAQVKVARLLSPDAKRYGQFKMDPVTGEVKPLFG